MARRRRQRSRKRGHLWLYLAFLGILAAYYFIHSSFFAVETVAVEGVQRLDPQEVTSLAAIGRGTNLWTLPEKQIAARLSMHPLIQEARVERRWPRTVKLVIREREAVALLPVKDGFLELDRQAVALRQVDTITSSGLPVISGLPAPPGVVMGGVLKDEGVALGLEIAAVANRVLPGEIVQIDVGHAPAITVYHRDGAEVRLGMKDRLEEKLKIIDEILAQEERPGELEYIDISARPVVKYRESR